jgi:hypothetical protein
MAPTTRIVSSLYTYFLNCLLVYSLLHDATQSHRGGEVNILGGDSSCHCEKEFHMNTCLILNGYRDRAD